MLGPVRFSDDQALLIRVQSAVVGATFVGVRYAVLEGDRWPSGHRSDSIVHELEMGLSIDFGSTVLSMTWAMDGSAEGVALALDATPPDFFGIGASAINVAAVTPWPSLVGRKVSGISWAWHESGACAMPLLWSIRMKFEGGASVVVALGSMDGGHLRYLPDALVAVFDERTARSYRLLTSRGSAWGEAD